MTELFAFHLMFKNILQTLELIDVYCFGHLLYEMTFGTQLNEPTCDSFPLSCPAQIREFMLFSYILCSYCKNVKLIRKLYWWFPFSSPFLEQGMPEKDLYFALCEVKKVVPWPCCAGSVLESILTTEACKNGLPQVSDLLLHP